MESPWAEIVPLLHVWPFLHRPFLWGTFIILIFDEKKFGEGHPSTATLYSNLATVLQDLGDYEGARVLLEKAVASDEKNFGKGHPSTAGSYSNLAMLLRNLGDYEQALELSGKALAIFKKVYLRGIRT
ncbi:MAG: tetratricopeptide repeat protein [Bacteroidota bacterium]|nr:tetratricopeptide repeat protein [Bacteroidota bacterium]